MTDLKRHSLGYWRSIYIFSPSDEQYYIQTKVEKKLKGMNLKYSYCHYGEVKSPDRSLKERAHITFRVNFPDLETMKDFSKFLEKEKWEFEDHNYDEPLWVKEAYVLGTQLFKKVSKVIESPDISLNPNFLRLLFHGFFNDLHYSYKDETELYFYLFKSMLSYAYHLKPKE